MNQAPRQPFQDMSKIVGVGHSADPVAQNAVAQALSQISTDAICFVLVFVPHHLDHDQVASALEQHLPNTPVFGCTTAGQITPHGYEDNMLLMVAFPRQHFRCASNLIQPLNPVSIEQTARQARTLNERFRRTANWNRFAITFADGMSKKEDMLIAALSAGLDEMQIFGGSAGHGLEFDATFVLHCGSFQADAAVLIIIETDLEFVGLEFDHFLPTSQQLVVTDAQPDDRIVREINGSPAAVEYARLIGHEVAELSPQVFAENPVLVRNHGSWHVRAIQQANDDDSLSFLSAIESGLVLTLGRGKEILETLETELSVKDAKDNTPDFILGFDCVLRRLEIEQNDTAKEASTILQSHRVLGFNTYGEQHCGIHMNQTFVGIAFFPPGHTILP